MKNPYRFRPPPGWNDHTSAPRDGTVIELQNNFGIAPTFDLFHWVEGRGWVNARIDFMGCGDGSYISWRPYEGRIEDYVDPTNGRQNTREYWLEAMGNPPRLLQRLNMTIPDPPKPQRRGFWAWLFNR